MDVGIVGTADRITSRCDRWDRIDGVSVVGVVPTDGASSNTGARVYEDIDGLLAAHADVVDCVTEPADSRRVTVSVIEAEVPTVVPWPPGPTVADAEAVVAAAAESNRPVLAAMLPRFDPARRRVRERVGDGVVGDVGNVRISRRVSPNTDLLRTAALELDFVRWVCGNRDLDRVFVRRADGIGAAVATGRLTDDTVFHIDVRRGDDLLGFEFTGDAGLVEFNSRDSAGASTANGPVGPGDADPTARFLAHVRDCVAGEVAPVVDVEDAVVALRLAEAMSTSTECGCPVDEHGRPNS
jgi:predicted dehydrogenase